LGLPSLQVGIDVGGTFTDAVAVDEVNGTTLWSKVPSTPPTFVDGVVNGLDQLNIPLEGIRLFLHASTIGINALVERKLPPGALICTEGFRDFLEIRHSRRPELYDIHWEKPAALIPRKYRVGISERIGPNGKELIKLDENQVRRAVTSLRREGIVTYAVSTLFSFANPSHEKRIRKIILEEQPGAFVSISSEIAPIIREYERTSTTVINALLAPIVSRYIESLAERLQRKGIDCSLQLLRSNGGSMSVETAKFKPVELLEGGHAAGNTLAAFLSRIRDSPNVIVYDGGGTTATLSLVENHEPVYDRSLEYGFDVLVNTSSVAIKSIGQGGGAIAWIDKGGALRVGPMSAGSVPGPACYGLGGKEVTLTDALVILGILDPEKDWIKNLPWDLNAAERGVSKIGSHFGWNVKKTAYAIYKIAISNVSALLHEEIIAKGRDPRDFVMLVMGGSGPLFAGQLALEQNISKVMVPAYLGTASALGCVLSDQKYDYLQSFLTKVNQVSSQELEDIMTSLRSRATTDLKRDKILERLEFEFFVDLRYAGEHWEVTVPLKSDASVQKGVDDAVRQFHSEHERLYGFSRIDEPVEIVTIMMRMTLRHSKPEPRKIDAMKDPATAVIATRKVFFDGVEGKDVNVYAYDKLGNGSQISGPAIIQRRDGTVPVFPGFSCEIDPYGNIMLNWRGQSA
jgi:N-methylhydantoinase A/oxoprolinase/acetone carboxylase beta subunit